MSLKKLEQNKERNMRQIEYSFAAIKSLSVNSTSGSEDEDIVEIDDEDEAQIGEEEIAETVMSVSDEDFEQLDPSDFAEALGDDNEEEGDTEADEEEPADSADDDGSEQAEEDPKSENDQPIDDEESIDPAHEAAYKELFGQPIKASGRNVNLRDAEHARSLIQLGVDYNKKMQHMRPHQQTLKTLEKEGLLNDTEQLNLLLEAKQGNPNAIRKLISQANIDVLDIADDEDGGAYTPQNHMVSAEEVAISEALSAIKGSDKYDDTINVMSNVFDQKSREVISDNPNYITALNSDIESGVYDNVMEAVNYRKDIGAVPTGMSDIELYISTVQEMSAAEANNPTPSDEQPEPAPVNRRSTGASRKRKAAMSGSRGARKKKEPNFDPMDALGMSDDAFEKQFGDQLL